jgi:probable phosphoglycerate mutase
VRTHQTLAPFIDAGYELKTHSGLNEFNWGKWEGQRFDRDFREIIQPYVLEWQAGNLDLAVPGGESPKQAWHRAQAAFAEILSNHSAGNVLVCSHGRLIRILLAGVLNNDLRLMQQYPHENTGLYILARPSAQDAFVVEKANCVAHLD